MIARLAFRNVLRNRWRTGLTVAGIAVGVAMLVWTLGYLEGFKGDMIRGATSVASGQIQITTPEYAERPAIESTFAFDLDELQRVQSAPGIKSATPRLIANGLIGDERRSTVAQLVGVLPESDAETMTAASGIVDGDWVPNEPAISPDAEPSPISVVLGQNLANQLDVKVGDELVTFFEAADGSLGNDLLKVHGIVKTGNSAIDRAGVFLHIEDLQVLAALEGQVHFIAVAVDQVIGSEGLVGPLQNSLTTPNIEARHWGDIYPQIYQLIQVTDYANVVYYFFIYLIVAFGLFNASRMSALERRREFAMMMAIGVPRNKLFWTVLLETVLITFLGAIVGVLLGGGYAYYLSIHGLDMAAFTGGEGGGFQYQGVNVSQVLYFVVTPKVLFEPVLAIIPVAFLCGIWPAITAVRTNILKAISDRS